MKDNINSYASIKTSGKLNKHDSVRVRKDLVVGDLYGQVHFRKEMVEMLGKLVSILFIENMSFIETGLSIYLVNGSDGSFTKEMFEGNFE